IAPQPAVLAAEGHFGNRLLALQALVAGFQVNGGAQAQRVCGWLRQELRQPEDPGQLHMYLLAPSSLSGQPAGPDGGRHAGRHGEAAYSFRGPPGCRQVGRPDLPISGGQVEVARTLGSISPTETERFCLTAVTLGGFPEDPRRRLPGAVTGPRSAFSRAFKPA